MLILGVCNPTCKNNGLCISGACKCTEYYEGKSCEIGTHIVFLTRTGRDRSEDFRGLIEEFMSCF